MPEVKTCAKCRRTFPATSEFFGAERNGKLKSSCRECGRAYGKAHYAKNRDRIAAHQAAYRATHPAEVRESRRAYNAKHRAERAAYRAAHLSERNAYSVAYRREGAAGLMYLNWRKAGCAVCGECNPLVVQAHHHDPSGKEFTVSHITAEAVMSMELRKCIPLCANHHIIVHDLMRKTGMTSREAIAILEAGV